MPHPDFPQLDGWHGRCPVWHCGLTMSDAGIPWLTFIRSHRTAVEGGWKGPSMEQPKPPCFVNAVECSCACSGCRCHQSMDGAVAVMVEVRAAEMAR